MIYLHFAQNCTDLHMIYGSTSFGQPAFTSSQRLKVQAEQEQHPEYLPHLCLHVYSRHTKPPQSLYHLRPILFVVTALRHQHFIAHIFPNLVLLHARNRQRAGERTVALGGQVASNWLNDCYSKCCWLGNLYTGVLQERVHATGFGKLCLLYLWDSFADF